jgi:succinate dehydrogenase / fumarate reductase membrane anchor subunit
MSEKGKTHWILGRITSLALIPLTLLFLFPFAGSLGESWEQVTETFSRPWNAIVAVLFLAVGFFHLQQGLQVVIEDYTPNLKTRGILLLGNTVFNLVFGLMGVVAVLMIAFG